MEDALASMLQQVQTLTDQMGQVTEELKSQRARADAAEAKLAQGTDQKQFLQEIAEAVASGMKKSSRGEGSTILVDKQGIGKPQMFRNQDAQFHEWAGKLTNYACATLGEGVRGILDFCAEHEAEIRIGDIDEDL